MTEDRTSRHPLFPALAPALLPLAFFLAVTFPGVDFGYHWDEGHGQMTPLEKSLERGTLLPGHYIYPGLNYWINLSALAPDFLRAWRRGEEIRPALVEATRSDEVRLRARRIRLVLSSLAVVWVYLIVLALGRRRPEAFLAAWILALSWEVAYHSRWPAPDSVMMQFGALSLLGSVLTLRRPEDRVWPYLAAAAAGLACGVKYPGGMFFFFVLLALALREERLDAGALRRLAKPSLKVGGAFAAVYLLTTPGTVLEYRTFVSFIRFMTSLYGKPSSTYTGITVDTGEHFAGIAKYLASVALSPYPALAVLLCALALAGALALLRQSLRISAVLLGFPALYILYFGTKKLMVVRNYQVLIPCLAVLAALGVGTLWRRAPRPWMRGLLALPLLGALAVNARWQVDAARSIVARHHDPGAVAALSAYVDERPGTRFLLSAGVAEALAAGDGRPVDSAGAEAEPDEVICYLYELGDHFPSNLMPGMTTWFGPREVNLNLYTTWRGDDRPVVFPFRLALELPLYMPRRIHRRATFPSRDSGREALLLAGREESGDQLFVEYGPDGTISFGLDRWGEDRWIRADQPLPLKEAEDETFVPIDRPVVLGERRAVDLTVFWAVLQGTVDVRVDGEPVFALRTDLGRARLDEFRLGKAAAVPGRSARAFSGTLE